MKKINIMILYFIELLIALVGMFSYSFGYVDEDFGLFLDGWLVYLPTFIMVLITLFISLEMIVTKSFVKRIIYVVFAFLVSVMMYNDRGLVSEYNAGLWVFSVPYAIIMIIVIAMSIFKAPSNNTKEKTTLSVGVIDQKQFIISFICLILMVLIMISSSFWSKYIPIPSIITEIIVAILALVIFLFILIKTNKLGKALKLVNYELNYGLFKQEINKIKLNNIHPETLNYLNLILANYSYPVDEEESFTYFEGCFKPTNKAYINLYNIVKTIYHINKNEFDEAKLMIDELRQKKANAKLVLNLELILRIDTTDDIIENIESYFPIDNKLKINNIINSQTLMKYYHSRGDMDNAKKYANLILSYNSDFTHIKNEALKVINSYENKNIE